MLQEHAYTSLLEHIGQTFSVARGKAYAAMNQQLLKAYWNIGRHIVEFEQKGYDKAVYGKKLIQQLSRDLSLKFGRGFSMTNLYSMRQFFEAYPIPQTLSAKLTWSHVTELVDISDPLARSFYEKQCANEGWSVRQLKCLEIPILFSRYGGVAAGVGGGDGRGRDANRGKTGNEHRTMKKEIIQKLHSSFEGAAHEQDGVEYWLARDLQVLLGYEDWKNFIKVIEKAQEACQNSGQQIGDHFSEVGKMVELGSGAKRRIADFMLTRYACYLIAQNGDPAKEPIAFAQTYFAVQTRKQELIEERLQKLKSPATFAARLFFHPVT